MPSYVNINGKLVATNEAIIPADSRAFRYGYGLFETMLMRDNQIRLANYHWERLKQGIAALQIVVHTHFFDEVAQAIQRTVKRNGHEALSRIRLQVWPSSGGYYDGNGFNAEYCIETFPLTDDVLRLNENGLVIGIAEGLVKTIDHYSHIKTSNALPYALAARQAKDKYWNDALLLNQRGNISDSTIANFFWVEGDKIFTPPLSEGCVAGIMRQHLLSELSAWGYAIQEQVAQPQIISTAQAVFLSNAVRGIRWVKSCKAANLSSEVPRIIHEELLRSF